MDALTAPVLGADRLHGKVTPNGSACTRRGLSNFSDFFRLEFLRNGSRMFRFGVSGPMKGPMTVLTAMSTDDHLGELVRVLWRQRALIETLQYRLEVQQLITASGRDSAPPDGRR